MTSDLAILQVKTLGRGHALAALVLSSEMKSQGLGLLDFFNLGGESMLILQGPRQVLASVIKDAPSRDLVRSQIIPQVRQEVLKALMNLDSAPIQSFSAVVECSFAGDLLKAAQWGVSKSLVIADLHLARRQGAMSSLILTAPDAKTDLKSLAGFRETLPADSVLTVIDPVQAGYAGFFSVAPLA